MVTVARLAISGSGGWHASSLGHGHMCTALLSCDFNVASSLTGCERRGQVPYACN